MVLHTTTKVYGTSYNVTYTNEQGTPQFQLEQLCEPAQRYDAKNVSYALFENEKGKIWAVCNDKRCYLTPASEHATLDMFEEECGSNSISNVLFVILWVLQVIIVMVSNLVLSAKGYATPSLEALTPITLLGVFVSLLANYTPIWNRNIRKKIVVAYYVADFVLAILYTVSELLVNMA